MQAEQKTWQYNSEYSYEANMSNWRDAVNFERKQYNETILTQEQAEMKFQEVYPKEDFNGLT